MNWKKQFNTLFFKIVITVIAGILCLTAGLSAVNIRASKQVYVNNFVESQDKIFDQIDSNIYELFRDVGVITAGVNSNKAIHEYLTKKAWGAVEEWGNILDMRKYLGQLPLADYSEFSMLLVGVSGKTFNYNSTARLVVSAQEILDSDVAVKAFSNPKQLICQYASSGFTDVMKDRPVIMMAKAITSHGGERVDGVVLLTIKEADFSKLYSYFTSGTSDIVIFNQDDQVISSSRKDFLTDAQKAREVQDILTEMKGGNSRGRSVALRGHVKEYMMQKLQSTNYTMLGIIDPNEAFDNAYSIGYIVGVTVLITLIVALIIFALVKQQTNPLTKLARNMQTVREGHLDNFARVEGTAETRELAETYNSMLVELDHYIQELVHVEEEKREAEIHSLQMQINPHYMYNTLASVKWLIWQGDKEKSVQVIDAFIRLLRNTISNKDEFITVSQEIENLRNYVLINQIRYGSQINVEYYVAAPCQEMKVPKLILQPFVENAFFHAFPEGRQGTISVFVKRTEDYLRFDITDDGVGMDYQKLLSLQNKKEQKSEHFTGIGVNNVDDRIKLIYGNHYGINITSEKDKGTTITIYLPLEKYGLAGLES